MSKFIEVYGSAHNSNSSIFNLDHVTRVIVESSGSARIYLMEDDSYIWVSKKEWSAMKSNFIPDKSEAFEGVDL